MATNQVQDAESLLTGPVYAVADRTNQYGKRKVTVMGGQGMQDINLSDEQIEQLQVRQGGFVAWWVRFGMFTPEPTEGREKRSFMFAAFLREATAGDLEQIARALDGAKKKQPVAA